jgi:DNA-binding LytR/AlgR family response regulator
MPHIAIVEDDPVSKQKLQEYLDRYQTDRGVTFEISCFVDGLEIAEDYRPIYNIILMDIEMPGLNGMDTARRIRELDETVILIFITNMAKYAIRGYEVGALDFMLKPVSYFAFSLKLDKALMQLRTREQTSILISTEEGMRKILTGEITYFEVRDHRLSIHTTTGVYTVLGSLADMEKRLDGQGFVRCNKGYLVNLRHVTLIKANSVLIGGDELLISRRRKESFLSAVTDYYGGGRV